MNYQEEFNEFIKTYQLGVTSPEATGLLIVKLASYFGGSNLAYGNAQTNHDSVHAKNISSVDEATGKQMSGVKAEALSKASEEGKALVFAKIDLVNLEQMMNALKSLQKGSLNEYSHLGNT